MPPGRESVDRLRAVGIRYPTLPLAVVATAAFLWFAASNGGYDTTTWYPGALALLGLVVIAVLALPGPRVPRLVTVAVLALGAYAAWSYLSITWAAQKGDAWDGANRTLLYVLTFALFAIWRPRARPAAVLLATYALGVAFVGLVEILRAASAANPGSFFYQGRFASPGGYMNANVALWFTAFWPCVTLGARREVHPFARGLLVAAAVVLCGLAVLGQSRGWLYMAPVATLVFIAIVPRRVRTTLTLLLVLAATGAITATLLDVYKAAGGPGFASSVSDAATAIVVAAAVAGVLAGFMAMLDRRARPSVAAEQRAGRALAMVAAGTVAVGLVVFVAAVGNPVTVTSDAWHDFKTLPTPQGGASRFSGTLGSSRYDFWRVAWNRFEHAPLAGIGADNFQEAYLLRRRSLEEPRYPHSVQLRALSQTGLVGFLILGIGLGAALMAAGRAIRRRGGLGAATAAAATASFAYWLLHGSVDWFWEFPALGAPAFALLGLAAGMMPRGPRSAPPPRRAGRPWLKRTAELPAAVLVLALLPAVSLGAPWLAALEQDRAVAVWRADPQLAYDRLDTAAALNPLSTTPKLLAGSIAVRAGDPARAERYFRETLLRDPGDAYAHLELGTLLAQSGRRQEGLATLRRGHELNPRDDIQARVLRRVSRGEAVSIAAVNRQIAERARQE